MRTIEPICGLSVSMVSAHAGVHMRGPDSTIYFWGPALWAIWVSILLIFSVNHRILRMTSPFSNCLYAFAQEPQGDVWMWFLWWLVMYSLILFSCCALSGVAPPPPPTCMSFFIFSLLSSRRRTYTKQKWRTFYWSFELKKKTRRSRSRSRSRR